MKNVFPKFITLAAIAGLSLSASIAHGEAPVGSVAPEFTLTDIRGETHSLSDFRGNFVVLEWLNHNCPFVVKFYRPGKMQSLQEAWTEQGVVWLSINSTHSTHRNYKTPEQEQAKADEVGSRATAILHDTDGTAGRAFGARTTPHIIIVNPEGQVVYNGAIDSVRSTNSDDIAGATNNVEAALTALFAGEPVATPNTRPYGCSVKFEGVR